MARFHHSLKGAMLEGPRDVSECPTIAIIPRVPPRCLPLPAGPAAEAIAYLCGKTAHRTHPAWDVITLTAVMNSERFDFAISTDGTVPLFPRRERESTSQVPWGQTVIAAGRDGSPEEMQLILKGHSGRCSGKNQGVWHEIQCVSHKTIFLAQTFFPLDMSRGVARKFPLDKAQAMLGQP